MKATIDRNECVGCGLCESTCPNVFEMGDDSVAVVIVSEIPANDEECAIEAKDECPVNAISID